MKHEATSRVVINISRDLAWNKLKDLSVPHHYVPGVKDCKITTEKQSGLGASRRVFQAGGRWLDETVTEWNEGVGLVLRLHKDTKGAPFPFSKASFRYRIEDAGHGKTALTTSLMFDLRMGAFGRFMYQRFLYKFIRGMVRDIALSQKHFYETESPVTASDLPELRAVAALEA
ncbi:SRPBCC family protein [Spongiibacter sp. KMU-158]|uniref:SRPBCC family protein n=1 Tax=Spongiibacter pelagi TaxID=2760804 RepID=A0A927C360_9GAMM|nr:SRPBCC family protein [Spongiibacter pelagi]MBD2858972.1 SRPBCC family protein [Spongiibacter pelagi]